MKTISKAAALGLLLTVATVGGAAWAQTPPAAAGPVWSRQCVKSPQGTDVCFLQQFVIAMPQKKALLKAVFSYLGPKGAPRLELTAPLGIMLQPGLTLAIDGHAPFTVPLALCQTGGCETVIDLDQQALNQFRYGKVAVVRYVTEDRKALDLPLRLDGLADALKSISP